jgi:hypothetical protein
MLKRLLLASIFGLINNIAFSQAYNYLSPFNSLGVPTNMAGRDVVTSTFLQRVKASFPEGYPVPSYNPEYIVTDSKSSIVVYEEADVWVTFVSEGAGYKNVLGFYTFDPSNPPTVAPTNSQITIVFPNVSASGSGGGLIAGDKVKLGTFPANTGIGWVLLANGYNGSTVTNGLWKLYSHPNLNPEANPNLRYHNVILNDSQTDRLVMGFEDIRRDYSNCDNDFNDALFYITASPNTALQAATFLETANVVGEVSSGNDGGLESDGSLATAITKRNVNKELKNNKADRNSPKSMIKASAQTSINTVSTGLADFLPNIGPDSSTAYVSTPTDLVGITNASQLLSYDYFNGSTLNAVGLVIKTINEVYSHTKNICDRVGGASILSTKTVLIRNQYPSTLVTFKKPDESIEYGLSFSARVVADSTFEYNSHWIVQEYATGSDYLSFQLWGKYPGSVFYMAESILAKLDTVYHLTNDIKFTAPPAILAGSGSYSQGKFNINILNRNKLVKTLNVGGAYKVAENGTSLPYLKQITLNGLVNQTFTLDAPGVFDAGLFIYDADSLESDGLYLADGAWVANYETENVMNSNLVTFPQDKLPIENNHYWIERAIEASGSTKNYYSIHRPLRLGLKPQDLSAYNYLTFTASGTNTVEIVISRKGIINWNDQARIFVTLTPDVKKYYIDLAQFINNQSQALNKTDINAVTFSVISPDQNYLPFNVKINQLAFSKVGACQSTQQVVASAYSKEKYESSGKLEVTNKNKTNANIQLSAANAIELLPGFEASTGAVLKAEIKGCGNN